MEIDGSYNFVWILFKVLSTGIFWFVFFFSRYNPYNNAIGSLTKKTLSYDIIDNNDKDI